MPGLDGERRESVLQHIRSEVKHLSSRLRATEPYNAFTTTVDRLRGSKDLTGAVRHVGWDSLVVLRQTPVACVHVTENDRGIVHASTAFADIPAAVAAAVSVAERVAAQRLSIGDTAVLKIGQLGIMAVWIPAEAFLVPLSLRSERQGLKGDRVYKEAAFVRAVLRIAARIAET